VRETLRIAAGEALDDGDPRVRGHAIQFRIYAEDPLRGFAPTGDTTVRTWCLPPGPGVRVDPGVSRGSRIAPEFGTLLAKLIVTGASRVQALRRARRALGEFEVDGVRINLPFHRWAVTDEAFAPSDPGRSFSVHTGWVETRW